MHRQVHNLILAAGCGLVFFGFGPQAEAGFIVTSLDSPQPGTTAFTEVTGFSSSKPVEQPPQAPYQIAENFCHTAFLAGPNSTGSMGSESVTTQGGFPPPAISPGTWVPSAGELSLRLSQQREPYHPRFIKSRLFRPPRC